jgi:hypothetical protein
MLLFLFQKPKQWLLRLFLFPFRNRVAKVVIRNVKITQPLKIITNKISHLTFVSFFGMDFDKAASRE